MHTVKLLEHQALLVQSPFVNSDIRFHFLIAGYASGKTSGLVYAILHTVKNLLGKKDEEGHNPKILVASKNLTFMKKTLTGLLEQDLKMTCSEYTYDKAHNIITIGNVELLLIPDEDESSIYGFSCYCFKGDTLVATSEGDKRIDEIKEGDLVFTRKGFKKVTHAWCSGVKDCISVNVEGKKIVCTPEHRFIDSFNNEVKAQDLTKTTSLVKIDTKEWRKWLNISGKIDESLSLLTSIMSDTTGTQNLNLTEKGATTPVHLRTGKKVIQLCTEICGLLHTELFQKDMMCTTKMETFLTILLRTLSLLQKVSMQKNTGNYNQRRKEIRLLKLLRMLKRSLLRCGKTQNTGKDVAKKLKKIYKTGISIVDVECVEKYLIHVCQRLYTALKIAKSSIIMLQQKINMQQIKKNVFVKFVEKLSRQTDMQLLKHAHLTAKTSNVVERCEVYDLEVEDAHEFFANGILVHNCSFVDELDELDTQTAMAVVKSINDRTRQQIEGMRSCFIMFTTSSQGLKGTYQTVMHFNKSNIGYVLIRARTKDNIYLPPDYIKNMYSIYNEKERDCLLEGKFVSIDSGLIFPDYDPKNNKLDLDLYDFVRNNPEYTIYIGQDFNGFGNNAVAFTVLEGSIIAIKDYEFPDIRRAPEVFRYDFPENRIVWVPDMTYKEHFSEFKKELKIFKIDLALRSCNPLVGDRNFACNKLFVAQRLFICPMCKGMETTLLTWQKDPRTGQPSKGGKGAPDHKGDCLGYVVHYLLSWKKELKYLYRVTLQRLYDARRARGTQATELEIDSHEINWDKLSFTKLKDAPNVVNNGD